MPWSARATARRRRLRNTSTRRACNVKKPRALTNSLKYKTARRCAERALGLADAYRHLGRQKDAIRFSRAVRRTGPRAAGRRASSRALQPRHRSVERSEEHVANARAPLPSSRFTPKKLQLMSERAALGSDWYAAATCAFQARVRRSVSVRGASGCSSRARRRKARRSPRRPRRATRGRVGARVVRRRRRGFAPDDRARGGVRGELAREAGGLRNASRGGRTVTRKRCARLDRSRARAELG